MIHMKDYEDASGHLDWDRYRAAQIAAGEKCTECGKFIVFGKGHPTTCESCRSFRHDDGEVRHEKFIRCPKCRTTFCPFEGGFNVMEDGEHDVVCYECNHEFTVSTSITYTFRSPPIVADKQVEA